MTATHKERERFALHEIWRACKEAGLRREWRRSKKNFRHLDIFHQSRCTLFLAVCPRLVQLWGMICTARNSLKGDSSMGLAEQRCHSIWTRDPKKASVATTGKPSCQPSLIGAAGTLPSISYFRKASHAISYFRKASHVLYLCRECVLCFLRLSASPARGRSYVQVS